MLQQISGTQRPTARKVDTETVTCRRSWDSKFDAEATVDEFKKMMNLLCWNQ